MSWLAVTRLDLLPVGQSTHLLHGEKAIAVFHRPDGLYALDNFCPHRGAQMHEGGIFEGTLICPWHQWQFDLKTGQGLSVPGSCLAVYPVRTEDNMIWVEVKD